MGTIACSKELRREATNYSFNVGTPIRIYLKICVDILNRAQAEFQGGNLCSSYKFYYRYVDLVTNKLSRHPEYVNGGGVSSSMQLYREEYLQLVKLELPCVMRIVEDLQKKIDLAFEKNQLSLAKNIAKSKNFQPVQPGTQLPSSFNESKFNQSVSFFTNNSITAVKPSQSKTDNSNSRRDKDENLLYPELPQLNTASY